MKIFQTRNFRRALIACFFFCALLARPAHAKVLGSNLHVPGIANISEASIASTTQHGLGGFEPAEPAVLETSHAAGVSLPPLAIVAPNSKWSAVFPMVGLVAAVAVTQLLRRRRIAQLRSDSSQ